MKWRSRTKERCGSLEMLRKKSEEESQMMGSNGMNDGWRISKTANDDDDDFLGS